MQAAAAASRSPDRHSIHSRPPYSPYTPRPSKSKTIRTPYSKLIARCPMPGLLTSCCRWRMIYWLSRDPATASTSASGRMPKAKASKTQINIYIKKLENTKTKNSITCQVECWLWPTCWPHFLVTCKL